MASEIATPAKDAAATEAEVVSVDLPAPAGWKKKFTPKKGGTPKRNEISFISPTGEEIASKRQLEQYLRAHPGGPPSSEFDWGTGDTPRRSARLSAKAKATETPEGEKPKKRERKSSGEKGTKGKKESEDGETEASEAADDAAAAEEAKGSADVEMKDAEGNVDKVKEDAGVEAEGEAQKELAEKTNEHIEEKKEGNQENESLEKVDQSVTPVVEEEREADKANKEKKDSEMLPLNSDEKKNENAEENKTQGSDMLPPTSEGKENDDAETEKPEAAALPQTFEPPKEEAPAEKDIKDGDAPVENDSFKDNRDAAVQKETQHPANCDDGQHQPRASPVKLSGHA